MLLPVLLSLGLESQTIEKRELLMLKAFKLPFRVFLLFIHMPGPASGSGNCSPVIRWQNGFI